MKKIKDFFIGKLGEKNTKWINILFMGALVIILLIVAVFASTHCWKHNYIATVTDPTCTLDGYTTYVCEKCGNTYKDNYTEALGHNLTHHDSKEPTCEDCGWNAYDSCNRCDYTTITKVEALGHSFTNYVYNNDATCTNDGTATAKCDRCDKTDTITCPSTAKGHAFGQSKITKTATPSTTGIKSQTCSVCGYEETSSYNLSSSEIKSWYKNNCKSYSYEEIFRNADKHEGEYVKFTGEVIQVINSYGSYTLRVNITKTGSYYTYYTDTIMIYMDSDDVENGTKILEDDIVTFYGKAAGTYTYTSVMGASVEVPLIYGEYATIN